MDGMCGLLSVVLLNGHFQLFEPLADSLPLLYDLTRNSEENRSTLMD